MTQASDASRVDQLEALGRATLLAIQQLASRDDQFENRQSAFEQRMEALAERQEAFQNQLEATQNKIDAIAEQTALNTAGITELRNLVADLIRVQQR